MTLLWALQVDLPALQVAFLFVQHRLAPRWRHVCLGSPSELVHSGGRSDDAYKSLKGVPMTEFLHVNMHTFYVAMIVVFGLVLGLMVVSSLHAGFLLTHV